MKKVVSLTRRAIEQYNMIEDGDKIAVGVSGGKDSLVLLNVLAELSRYYPKKFTVMGLTLDMGYDADYSKVQKMCDDLGVEYKVKKTNIKEIIFDIRKESNPCSLCAKMRRGALNDMAIENGCNKVALGHHNDDVLETIEHYEQMGLENPFIVIDTNHDNSGKRYLEQIRIVRQTLINRDWNEKINKVARGFMIESYLEDGRQDAPDVYGKSITDPCLGWDKTDSLIREIYNRLS